MSNTAKSITSKIIFPFEPYPQQLELMKSINECIDQAAVGCFESPTGTGYTDFVIILLFS